MGKKKVPVLLLLKIGLSMATFIVTQKVPGYMHQYSNLGDWYMLCNCDKPTPSHYVAGCSTFVTWHPFGTSNDNAATGQVRRRTPNEFYQVQYANPFCPPNTTMTANWTSVESTGGGTDAAHESFNCVTYSSCSD